MKRYLITAAATAALMFAACGDDSSSGAGDGSWTQKAALSVDEAQQTFIITEPEGFEELCVRELDGSVVWKNVKINPERALKYKYEFLGDTLVMYRIYDDDLDRYGQMYLGGTAGKIYGSWTNIFCEHNKGENRTECYEKDARYMTHIMKFSEGEIAASYEYRYDLYLQDLSAVGYMNSDFMYDLYNMMSYGYGEIRAEDITDFDEYEDGDLQSTIQEYNIEILETSSDKQTFKRGEKTYTVSLDKIDIYLSEKWDENAEISISLTDGSSTCNLDYVKKSPTSDVCKVEYVDDLRFEEDDDGYGNEYSYAYRYKKTNAQEFSRCVMAMAGTADPVQDPVYYKTPAKAEFSHKDRLQKFLKEMRTFTEK